MLGSLKDGQRRLSQSLAKVAIAESSVARTALSMFVRSPVS